MSPGLSPHLLFLRPQGNRLVSFLFFLVLNLVFTALLRCLFVHQEVRGKTFGEGTAPSKALSASAGQDRAGTPGVLSNVPPPAPANTRVSPEGAEQEPEPVLERRAQHPAPLGWPCRGNLRACKSPKKTRSEQNASARRRPCTARPCRESGEPPGLFLGIPMGGKQMSTQFLSARSQRDHLFHPSKHHTHSTFPWLSCGGDNDRGRSQEGMLPGQPAPGPHHGSAKPQLLPPLASLR